MARYIQPVRRFRHFDYIKYLEQIVNEIVFVFGCFFFVDLEAGLFSAYVKLALIICQNEKEVKTEFSGQKTNLRREREPGTGKGIQEPGKETGTRNGKSPGFLRDKSGTKNGTKKR